MDREPTAGCDNFHFDGIRGRAIAGSDKPPDRIEVFGGLRRDPKRRPHPIGFFPSARRRRNISSAASPSINSPRSAWANPVAIWAATASRSEAILFEVELFADKLERPLQHFIGVPIRSGLNRQIDQTLLFRFEVNRHRTQPFRFQS